MPYPLSGVSWLPCSPKLSSEQIASRFAQGFLHPLHSQARSELFPPSRQGKPRCFRLQWPLPAAAERALASGVLDGSGCHSPFAQGSIPEGRHQEHPLRRCSPETPRARRLPRTLCRAHGADAPIYATGGRLRGPSWWPSLLASRSRTAKCAARATQFPTCNSQVRNSALD